VQVGDGPAAVTGDERREEPLTAGLGRCGARMIRESEDLPENPHALSVDKKAHETRIKRASRIM
jgi:hypothetical protein